ncbi:MAG: alpha-glucan family phosphorylase [Candidatus Woesebacteria bacterium]
MSDSLSTIDIAEVGNCITTPPVAYFCAEFAVDQKLPLYAGGLGILAGDILGQADEDGKSYIGVGMMYHHGYMHQAISKEANVFEEENFDPQDVGLRLLTDKGETVIITLNIHARSVKIKTWVYMLGKIPLLLMDTDVEGNEAQDAGLCDRLYYGDREHRFKQEMILGIGGLRLLTALHIAPRLYHLNEGHSALMLFEHARTICSTQNKTNVTEVLENLTDVVFTNHTLVPAGNDVFSKDLVISYLASFALEFPVDPAVLVKFGLIQDSSLFSPTMLALRLATVSQAVSRLHANKALESWPDHPLIPVTNGVHKKFWQTSEIAKVETGSEAEIWAAHLLRKKKLRQYVQDLTGFEWNESDLFIGWSRRLANYKRPLLLFEDIERLKKILTQSQVPVRVLFAGKPHAHDEAAQENLRQILQYVGDFGGSIVYIQNYSIDVAKLILSGVDLLLNTPVRGFEACGTSGMKASINGVLLATTLDGWTDEVSWGGIGWVLNEETTGEAVYKLLESDILLEYVNRDTTGLPKEWITRMKKAIAVANERFTTKRLLEELENTVYSQTKPEGTV